MRRCVAEKTVASKLFTQQPASQPARCLPSVINKRSLFVYVRGSACLDWGGCECRVQLRIFNSPKMTDSKYFTTTKKGEIFELKSELNNDKKEKKKEAVKKVIASMTVGKDVSALFPDVVNCMQTDNLELKKLVYLYLMN
uniref:Clathrin/coatomer adaptor adaptin-like N-terminal domain-containing protein n=1 Tax=Anopheles maculatus TaxID=74869 RepID=A0A182SV42_9DIPT